MEPAFLLQFYNYKSLHLVVDISLLKKSFCETAFVEAFEDVLFSDISEYLDDFVNSVIQVWFVDSFEVFLKHFV